MRTIERDSRAAKLLRGLAPARWGASGWTFLHYVALGYPTLPTARHIREYGDFLRSIQNVLPCESCREHMAVNVRTNPPDEALRAGKDALFAWTVDLHNVVNRALGKRTVDARVVRERLLAGPYRPTRGVYVCGAAAAVASLLVWWWVLVGARKT
jgi:hypothetical protein